MTTAVPVRSSRSITVAGAALLLSAALALLSTTEAGIAVTEDFVVPLHGALQARLAVGLELLAAVLLAVGRPSVVGDSTLARWSLVLALGVRLLGSAFVSLTADPGLWVGYTVLGLTLVGVPAAVLATIAMRRAGAVRGPAPWLLLPIVLVDAVVQGASMTSLGVLAAVVSAQPYLIREMLVAALGIALLLHGRRALVRRRLRIIRERW